MTKDKNPEQEIYYRSYLLRLWRDGARASWRASLHCTATDEQFGFRSIADLVVYLQALEKKTGNE